MKRLGTILVAMMLLAVACNAEIAVNFSSGSGTLTDNGGSALNQGSLFLVYHSPDASSSGFNSADPTSPGGGDSLLGAFDITGSAPLGGRITGHTSEVFGSGSTGYASESVYIAVFDYDYSAYSGSVPVDTYYGLGYVYNPTTERFGVSPTPTADAYGPGVSSIQTSMQVVPEPGALALFGLGLVVLGVRVFKRGE